MAFLAPKTGTNSTASSPQPYDIDGALPVVFGRQTVACKLIESPWGHVKMDHGSRLPSGHVYSLAVAVCHGPVDRLFAVRVNGKALYPVAGAGEVAASRGAVDYADLTYWSQADKMFNNTGKIRVYWGTDSQSADSLLNGAPRGSPIRQPPRNPNGSSRVHPPYTGICYLVFDVIHLDDEPGAGIRGSTSIPTIEADVFVAAPDDVFEGDGASRYERGCNPLAVARELLRNPVYGAGLPVDMLPEQPWTAAAQQFYDRGLFNATGVDPYLSPLWEKPQELGNLLGDFFAYFNGFLMTRNGQLLPGYIPDRNYETGELAQISRHDCTEEPDIDPQGWDEAYTEVEVKARVWWEHNSEQSYTARSPYVRKLVGEDRRKTVDAPFIIHPSPAESLARRTLQSIGQPSMRIAARVMPGRAVHSNGSLIMPGDLVRFDYAPHELDIVCRVVEREDRRGEVRLVMRSEPTRYPEDYVEVEDPRERPKIDLPEVVANFRAFEMPDELVRSAWPPQVAILAQRPNPSIAGAQVWISGSGDYAGEEQLLDASLAAWATRVFFPTSFDASSGEVAFRMEGQQSVALSRSFTAAEQLNGSMLLISGSEIMSLGAFAFDGEFYNMAVRRGMWGTEPQSSSDSYGWLISKAELLAATINHELFRWSSPFFPASARAWFKLRTYTPMQMDDDLSSAQFVNLRDRTPDGPENWGFVKVYTSTDADRHSYVVLPSADQYQLGSNRDLEGAGVIDTVEERMARNFGLTSAVETWPTHGLRRAYGWTVSRWTIFRFLSWTEFPISLPVYYEGKSRRVSGIENAQGPEWQNLDGGQFIKPIGGSAVLIHSVFAQRLTGTGGYEIGIQDWSTGDVSQLLSGSGSGFAPSMIQEWTGDENLYVRIPSGTAYRFSFMLRHRPD